MAAIDSPTILDPLDFAFFKGLNDPAVGGVLSAAVTDGLPAGTYRMASIHTSANHAPAIAAVAQHGFFDDIVYVRLSTLTRNQRLTHLPFLSSLSRKSWDLPPSLYSRASWFILSSLCVLEAALSFHLSLPHSLACPVNRTGRMDLLWVI